MDRTQKPKLGVANRERKRLKPTGGNESAFEKCRPVLQAMASEILHVGPIGRGIVMKLVNNMFIQVQWIVVAEGLVLGVKAGLDAKTMVNVVGNATSNSVAFQYSAPRILVAISKGSRSKGSAAPMTS